MKPVSLLTDILLSIAEATKPLTRVKAKLCGFNVSFIKRRRWWLKRFNYFWNKATRSCSDFAPSKFVRTTAFAFWWSLVCFQPQSRFWPPHVKTCLDFNRCDVKAGSCSSFLPNLLALKSIALECTISKAPSYPFACPFSPKIPKLPALSTRLTTDVGDVLCLRFGYFRVYPQTFPHN